MSHQTGIKANAQLLSTFANSKEGGLRMLKVAINDNEELTLDAQHPVKSADWQTDYNDMVLKAVEPNRPCYIFYRLDETNNSGGYTWLFITWSPDPAPIKLKMLYAATKSTAKQQFGAGQLTDDLFGTVRDDISLDGYLRHVRSRLAPAPLTNREEELEILKQSENPTRISVDSKHKTLQGVMFPVECGVLEKLNAFESGQCDYMQLAIDLSEERIVLDSAHATLSVAQLVEQIPVDKGRFHLYRYKHTFESEACAPVVFVYSMPGFKCSVKERMLYSSCKSELLAYLRSSNARLDIAKTFEVSEPSELNEQQLLDELHPRKQADGLKFEKPKGPGARGPRRVTRPTTQNASNDDNN